MQVNMQNPAKLHKVIPLKNPLSSWSVILSKAKNLVFSKT